MKKNIFISEWQQNGFRSFCAAKLEHGWLASLKNLLAKFHFHAQLENKVILTWLKKCDQHAHLSFHERQSEVGLRLHCNSLKGPNSYSY